MKQRRTRGAVAPGMAAAMLFGSLAAAAGENDVDLELVLAVDVSYSMSLEEQAVQRQGYVDAFRRPEVLGAIRGGPLGRIAATYVEWGGRSVQVVPWTVIDSSAAAERFASALNAMPLQRLPFTSISNALLFSRSLFRANAFDGARKVVDVSGDGPNNGGAPVPLARNTLLAAGIVIDGLAVMLESAETTDAATIPDLDAYYEHCVIGGRGAFVMKVTDAEQFAETIRRKLVLEISGPKLTRSPDRAPTMRATYAAARSYNCLVGEELLERRS